MNATDIATTAHILADHLAGSCDSGSDPLCFAHEAMHKASRLADMAATFERIEHKLHELGYVVRRGLGPYDLDPAPGEYEVTYRADRGNGPSWGFTVWCSSAVEGAQKVRIAQSGIMSGWCGPDNDWCEAFTDIGWFSLRTVDPATF